MQPVKVVMTWDIREDEQSSYVEYVVGEFVPGLQRLGFQVTGAWYTQYGNGPQIILTGTLPDRQSVQQLFDSADYLRLRERLLRFVDNFHYRLSRPGGNTPF